MHDIGRPTIIQAIVERNGNANDQTRNEVAELVAIYGNAVAARLVSKWGLPDEITQAILSLENEESTSPLGETLRLAVAFATCVTTEDGEPDFSDVFKHPSASRLNLYRDNVESLCDKAEPLDAWVSSVL